MFVGADGCKGKWFAVILTEDGDWDVDLLPDIYSLWNKYQKAQLILVDVPIGLRERGNEERQCDKKARKRLGRPLGSSVFPAPCRQATTQDSYEKASNINRQVTGRGLSRQTWSIIPYIKQIDTLLIKEKSAKLRIKEVHPELCFWALAGGCAMENRKRSREGKQERKQVLESAFPEAMVIVEHAKSAWPRSEVGEDDILDALVAAITASFGRGKLSSIPEKPERDSQGLPMRIVFYHPE